MDTPLRWDKVEPVGLDANLHPHNIDFPYSPIQILFFYKVMSLLFSNPIYSWSLDAGDQHLHLLLFSFEHLPLPPINKYHIESDFPKSVVFPFKVTRKSFR